MEKDKRDIFEENEAVETPTTEEESTEKKPNKKALKIVVVVAAVLVALTALALFLPFGLLSTPLDRNGMVLQIDDYKVMADEYRYASLPIKEYIESSYPEYFAEKGEEEFFSVLEKSFKQDISFYNWALEEGFGLTEEEKQGVADYINEEKSYYASEEEYTDYLASYHLNEDLYRRYLEKQTVQGKFDEYLYTQSEYATVTAADEEAFIAANEVIHYEIIGILLTDDEAVNATKQKLAETLAASLKEDPALFYQQKELYNEDPMAAYYPNGITSINGENTLGYQIDPSVDAAISALKIGEATDVMTFSDGYYIFYRSDVIPTDLHAHIIGDKVNAAVNSRTENAQVKYGYGYDRITVENLVPEK